MANYFPAIEGQEFEDLKASIKKNGQLNPIILFEGKILDGKNRFRACQELGINPITQEYSGNDPLDFVIAENINRRHLTESQRAMLATKMLPEFEKMAKERKEASYSKAANARWNKNASESIDSDVSKKKKAIRATEEAGKQFNVSGSSVQRANRINKAVEKGELEKDTIEDIVRGKKTVNAVDKELHDKRFIKDVKEKEASNNKNLPNKYPKVVSEYIHDLKEFKNIISTATKLANEGMFSPESIQYIHRIHEQIKTLMEEMEENKNE